MIEFREISYNEDLDSIIKLIHNNLDPDFTREHFIWKHYENPYGKSYGLLALDGEKLVGLRMFMFWKFFNAGNENSLIAVRPVDTVVDQDYRGQGLFKKLTLQGLEECKAEYDFIFNTPNENSLPGYLKMGWRKLEQENHIRIALLNPFYKPLQFEDIEPDLINYKDCYSCPGTLSSYKSSAYFKWRYKSAAYNVAFFPTEEVYVAYGNSTKYIIIYEVFGRNVSSAFKLLNSLAIKKRKLFIYFYSNNCFQRPGLAVTFKRQKPVIVLKNHEELKPVKNFNFSLADLESVF